MKIRQYLTILNMADMSEKVYMPYVRCGVRNDKIKGDVKNELFSLCAY